MEATTNPIETCQACGQGIHPGESVLVLGPTVEKSRAIHKNPDCFLMYAREREPEPIQSVRIMSVEEWLEQN